MYILVFVGVMLGIFRLLGKVSFGKVILLGIIGAVILAVVFYSNGCTLTSDGWYLFSAVCMVWAYIFLRLLGLFK